MPPRQTTPQASGKEWEIIGGVFASADRLRPFGIGHRLHAASKVIEKQVFSHDGMAKGDVRMPNDQVKRELLAYRTRIAALQILRQRKSTLNTKVALWQSLNANQARSAEIDLEIDNERRILKEVWVLAISLMLSLAGGVFFSARFAHAAGYKFVHFSWNVTRAIKVGEKVSTIGGLVAPSLTMAQWMTSRIGTVILIGLPSGIALQQSPLGASGLAIFIQEVLELIGQTPDPHSELAGRLDRMRSEMTAEGLGSTEFQQLMQDPNARRELVASAISDLMRERVT
ncbi:MAG: hypothetical protein H0T56_14155 [Pseudaminobacter sp.]|nr:hypothetical protein [Pseudaminobacter sp.]